MIYGVERWRDGMSGDVTVRISAMESREMGDEYVGYLLSFVLFGRSECLWRFSFRSENGSVGKLRSLSR